MQTTYMSMIQTTTTNTAHSSTCKVPAHFRNCRHSHKDHKDLPYQRDLQIQSLVPQRVPGQLCQPIWYSSAKIMQVSMLTGELKFNIRGIFKAIKYEIHLNNIEKRNLPQSRKCISVWTFKKKLQHFQCRNIIWQNSTNNRNEANLHCQHHSKFHRLLVVQAGLRCNPTSLDGYCKDKHVRSEQTIRR